MFGRKLMNKVDTLDLKFRRIFKDVNFAQRVINTD